MGNGIWDAYVHLSGGIDDNGVGGHLAHQRLTQCILKHFQVRFFLHESLEAEPTKPRATGRYQSKCDLIENRALRLGDLEKVFALFDERVVVQFDFETLPHMDAWRENS